MWNVCLHFFVHKNFFYWSYQRDIEQAKKGWELSHLQSLKEEEERLADEEDSTIMLTYDRPEVANKVILRKKSAVGGWEIVHNKSYPTIPCSVNNTNSQLLNNHNVTNICHQSHNEPSSCTDNTPISAAANCNHQKLPSRITRTVTVDVTTCHSNCTTNSSNVPRRSSRRITSW